MTLYNVALFVHLIGVIALFGGLVMIQNGGRRLRGASSWSEARIWLGFLRPIRGMFSAGAIFLLLSGLYMTQQQWTFATPWVVVGIVVVVSFAFVGALVVGRHLAALGRAAATREGAISAEGRAELRSPTLWSAVHGMNGGAIGILWLMAVKPDWAGSIVVPLVLSLIGWAVGRSTRRSERLKRADRPDAHSLPGGPIPHG